MTKICGGQFALASPYTKFWGGLVSPVIYAHADMLQKICACHQDFLPHRFDLIAHGLCLIASGQLEVHVLQLCTDDAFPCRPSVNADNSRL